MRVNACGKDCAVCSEYLAEKCRGCGTETTALCAIARCAEKKCFDKCAECWKNDDCKKLTQKEEMPTLRREDLRYAADRRIAQENAKALRLWLTVLGALAIPRGAALLLSLPAEALLPGGVTMSPQLTAPQMKLLLAACHVLYGVVLLLLSHPQEKYRPAGLCVLLSGAAMAAQPYVGEKAALALAAVYLLLCFIGEYCECAAHADTALGVDRALTESWDRIWKWVVLGQTAVLAAWLLLPYVLPLAAMALIALMILLPRVYLRKLSRLWQVAQGL